MITCEPFNDIGVMRVSGTMPNGDVTVVREVAGQVDVPLRGGIFALTSGALDLDDTEAPLGVPITYRVSVSSIPDESRVIQQNMLLTPTFTHGQQGWLPGTGRTMTLESDATAHSATVAHVTGNGSGVAAAAAPTYVGHVDSTVFTNASYTLTPPTTGGTAIATNDWMVLVHQQVSSVAAPATPAGWTLIEDLTVGTLRQLTWTRKRLAGDTGYTVTVTSGALAIGSLLWVRGATQDEMVQAPTITGNGSRSTLTTGITSVLGSRLTVSLFSADTSVASNPPVSGSVAGATWRYTDGSGTNPRSLTVGTDSATDGGNTGPVTTTYDTTVTSGIATSLSFQAAGSVTNRIIATFKSDLLVAAATPYLLTGRFRFVTGGLTKWSEIKTIGTWQQVKTAKATWLAARGSSSTTDPNYTNLFLSIVNPATGAYYVAPVQVYVAAESRLDQWTDFSVLFSTPVDIPATAVIRLMHGSQLKEYAIDWYLDEFGITPGDQYVNHDTLYWFDGDTPPPTGSEGRLDPVGNWQATVNDASITWAGAAGNSTSLYQSASAMVGTTTCVLDTWISDVFPCEPVLLSDPINSTISMWTGLIHVDTLTHPSKQAIHQIINRAAAVAISQVRGWETGSLQLLTLTIPQRNELVSMVGSGRVLLLRNPIPDYPENNWYLALGDITEERPIPNQRLPERLWTVPFVRVERPTGIIEASVSATWQSVSDVGTWGQVKTDRDSWLGVLLGVPAS